MDEEDLEGMISGEDQDSIDLGLHAGGGESFPDAKITGHHRQCDYG